MTLKEAIKEIEALRLEIERVKGISEVHPLSGLQNLTAFQRRCGDIERLSHYMVVFVDLDGLKAVNDTQGHDVGDVVIQQLAKGLRKYFRYKDVYHIYGDEFVVIYRCNGGLVGIEERMDGLTKGCEGVCEFSYGVGSDKNFLSAYRHAEAEMRRMKVVKKALR